MKILVLLLFAGFSFQGFSQERFYNSKPEFIRSHNIRNAREHWIFFDEDGLPRDTMELTSFHYDEEGKKQYVIECTLDIVKTRDSIEYHYDEKGREVLQRKHIEINPEKEVSTYDASWMDTLTEWRTIYSRRKKIIISPHDDTTTTRFTKSGRIFSVSSNYQFVRYYYNGRGRLTKKKEIPFAHYWGEDGGYVPTDTIITRYFKNGNPISTVGSKKEVEYQYENDLLHTEQTTTSEWGDTRFISVKYQYDSDGRVIAKKQEVNGEVRNINTYEYDSKGILTKEISHNLETGDIELIIETVYE